MLDELGILSASYLAPRDACQYAAEARERSVRPLMRSARYSHGSHRLDTSGPAATLPRKAALKPVSDDATAFRL